MRRWRSAVVVGLAASMIAACGSKKREHKHEDDEDPVDHHSGDIREAKNTLGAIARGAVGAYERETTPNEILSEGEPAATFGHSLCKSARPVPSLMPSGKKVQPSANAGEDFETGDAMTGWKCLKFTITSPIKFQYDYRQGSGYKGPARGGPDPGPDGFEASAEADLDGDGKKTTLITQVGTVNKTTLTLKLATELFVAKEFD